MEFQIDADREKVEVTIGEKFPELEMETREDRSATLVTINEKRQPGAAPKITTADIRSFLESTFPEKVVWKG